MADTPQDLLNDPEFQKLSPEAQHIVIGQKFPEYAKLSPEAQKIVLSKAQKSPSILSPEEEQRARTFQNMTAAISGQPLSTPSDQKTFEQGRRAGMGSAASVVGSAVAPELASGKILRTILSAAGAAPGVAAGQENPTVGGVAGQSALQFGVPQAVGEVGEAVGPKLNDIASQSLARILRLSPKAFQFGREPAQEVLERGLASGSLSKTAESIGEASKQVTSDLKDVLHNTPGTVNVENHAIDVANQMPGNAGNRFLQVVDDAAQKLGLRNNQLTSLTAEQANALKQEVAKQSRFVEGDLRPTVATAGKMFGGRLKDELVKLAPQASDLLESSANLTEASKSADYAVRAEKAGQSKGLLGGVQVNKPGTYARAVTDSPTGAQALFNLAQSLKDHTSIANALRTAFAIIYPGSNAEATQ